MATHHVEAAVEAARSGPDRGNYPAAFQATAARVPDRVALRTASSDTPDLGRELALPSSVSRGARRAGRDIVAIGSRCCPRNGPELAIADVGGDAPGGRNSRLVLLPRHRARSEYVLATGPFALVVEPALSAPTGSSPRPEVMALEMLDALDPPARFSFGNASGARLRSRTTPRSFTRRARPDGSRASVGRLPRSGSDLRRFDLLLPEPNDIGDVSVGPLSRAPRLNRAPDAGLALCAARTAILPRPREDSAQRCLTRGRPTSSAPAPLAEPEDQAGRHTGWRRARGA